MKQLIKTNAPFYTLVFVALLNTLVASRVEAVEPNPLDKPGWKLTFHDEFDNPLLDDLYWYAAYKTGGVEYLKRFGEHEANKVENGFFPRLRNPNALYKIESGLLKLMIDETVPQRVKKTDVAISCLQTSDFRYGNDETEVQVLDKFAQKYGWFEIRCKSIKGDGLYSAFWLFHTDPVDQGFTWPGGRRQTDVREIDIFEMLGAEATAGNNHFNVHAPKEGGHYQYKMGFDPSDDFHIYAMEWQEGEINWYVDNKKVQTYKGDTPQKKMFILLALFHGRDWAGKVSENQTYPIVFEVDYVRVYENQYVP